MKKVLITIVALVLFNIVNATENESREVNKYDKISVCCGIGLNILEGTSSKIEIETNIDPKYIITKVENKELQISLGNIPSRLSRNVRVKVRIFNSALSEVKASSGSLVESSVALSTISAIKLNSGASMKIEVDTKNIVVDANSGSKAVIIGVSKAGTLNASSGANIEAYGLKLESATAISSSGASVEVYSDKHLVANSSSGASIKYKGDPETKSLNEGWSSSVKKK